MRLALFRPTVLPRTNLAVDMEVTLKRSLAKRLKEKRILVAPGVFDMVSLRLADAMGFEALYVTGYGVVASHLGLPDAGLATYTEMVGRVGAMAAMAATPLIADGDTGYGGLLNIRRTVRGYEAAGAAAIQLEDQEFPKKCGHTPGRRVVAMEDMCRRIEVAVEARSDPEFLDRRAHGCAQLPGSGRGLAARGGLREGGRRHSLHRIAGERKRDGQDRPQLRRSVACQHGRGRTNAGVACAQAGGTGLSHCDLSRGGVACRRRRPADASTVASTKLAAPPAQERRSSPLPSSTS